MLLGTVAVREQMCSQEQIEEWLRIQSRPRSEAPLGDLLPYKGCLTSVRLKDLPRRRQKKPMACPVCRPPFAVVTLSDGKSAR